MIQTGVQIPWTVRVKNVLTTIVKYIKLMKYDFVFVSIILYLLWSFTLIESIFLGFSLTWVWNMILQDLGTYIWRRSK